MKVDKIKTFGEDALEWWWYLNVSEVNNEILICEFGWCFLSCFFLVRTKDFAHLH